MCLKSFWYICNVLKKYTVKSSEIRKLFEGNEKIIGDADTEILIEIAQRVVLETKITEDEMSYYFKVSIMDLASSGVDDETLENMKDDGWILSKDKMNLIKYTG